MVVVLPGLSAAEAAVDIVLQDQADDAVLISPVSSPVSSNDAVNTAPHEANGRWPTASDVGPFSVGRDDSDELPALVNSGVSSLVAGHDSLADDSFSRALAMASGHPGIVKWAAVARLRLLQPERALSAFSALREGLYDSESWRLIAAAYLQLGDLDAVFEALHRAIAVALNAGSNLVDARWIASSPVPALAGVADDLLLPELSFAFSALYERRFEDALSRVAAQPPAERDTGIWRAVAALAELGLGRSLQARSQLQQAITDDPAFGFAWAALAEIALAEGDSTEAERCFRASLKAEPADLRALMGMARLARLAGDLVAEQDWLDAAYRHHSSEPRVVLALAELLLRSGQPHEAGHVLANLDVVQAAKPDALRLLGIYDLQAGNFDAAVGSLSRLVSQRPESREAWFQLARAQAARGDIDTARHSFSIAIALDPEHSLPLLRLALAALELRAGRFEQALVLAEAVLVVRPDDSRAHDLLGAANAGLTGQEGRVASPIAVDSAFR